MESNKFFYNTIYNNKYKNFINEEIIDKNDNCYGPCYSPNTLYYHPTQLIPYLDEDNYTCPIIKEGENNNFMKCEPNNITNLDDTDLLSYLSSTYIFSSNIS